VISLASPSMGSGSFNSQTTGSLWLRTSGWSFNGEEAWKIANAPFRAMN
jgi:hypothetical protein